MQRKMWRVLLPVLAISLGLALQPAWAAIPKPQGVFTMPMEFDISTLDPGKAIAWTSRNVWGNLFMGLTGPSGLDWKTIPFLAASWQNVNQNTWKFTIRPGIRFQDGSPMTSADVKFSFDRVLGRLNPRFPGYLKRMYSDLIDTIETPDERTIVFTTKYVDPLFPWVIGAIFMVPKAYIEKVGDDAFADNPIGQGPYKFREWKRGESVTLDAFEDYFNTQPKKGELGYSKIKTVVFRVIPEMQTRIAALRAGELNAMLGVGYDSAKDLAKDPKIQLYYTAVNSPQLIMFNWRAEKDPDTGKPNPFLDVRVRQALNMALDLDSIIKHYLTGREYRTTMVGKGASGYNPKVPFYRYDPEKAKRLIKEAGYPDGFEVPFHVPSDVRPETQAIAQYWRDAGIRVQLKHTTQAVVMNQVLRKELYGLVHWNLGRGSETRKGFFDTMLMYDGMYALHAKDERVDKLANEWIVEFDTAKRNALTNELIDIVWKEAWYVPLWEPVAITALRKEWNYEYLPAVPGLWLTNVSPKK